MALDEELLRAVLARARRRGSSPSEVVEEALREHLDFDLLRRLWASAGPSEDEAMALAVEAQHTMRQ